MKHESLIQTQCINFLVNKGWHVIRINSGSHTRKTGDKKRYIAYYRQFSCHLDIMGANAKKTYSSAGMTDLLAFKNNRVLQIETKKPHGMQRMTQMTFETITNKHGNDYYIIRDISELRKLLRELKND
ncbi:hypothetical protein LCGC14_0342470 [marine sediment metagenome]|uniref:VRR-NUC domain-containing protein n=1 Tax=marine sediment metagenome TaxID=412755 RepID=A0A0F9TD82_9ZZZZ